MVNLTVTASGLSTCGSGADRLRGILFEGASGTILNSTVTGINRGASGCQEGNAIEVRNGPFDGTHPATVTVEIANNVIAAYQKTGIVANGDVNVSIHNNQVGASATQENLAANSVQLGFGALGSVQNNNIEGNQWKGTSNWGATAILIVDAGEVNVSQNNIRGNSDVGLYIASIDGGVYDNNRVFDEGSDHPNALPDYGIVNWYAVGNVITNNKIRGFYYPSYGLPEDNDNKIIPGPSASD